MTQKEFRSIDEPTLEFEDIKEHVCDTLDEVFKIYRTTEIPVGTIVGSGPLYQFCNEIVREFIQKL